LVRQTDDPACWDALATAASWSTIDLQIEIIGQFDGPNPEGTNGKRRELLRFLLPLLFEESATVPVEDEEMRITKRVRDVATDVLAGQVGFALNVDPMRGPFSRTFIRAAVAKAGAEEF